MPKQAPQPPLDERLVYTYDDLKARGLRYTRRYTLRLARTGKFPRPLRGGTKLTHWARSPVDQYFAGEWQPPAPVKQKQRGRPPKQRRAA
jgi:predicted DNA-binding transcriptional regulator AlpA